MKITQETIDAVEDYKRLREESERFLREYDYYKNGYERRGELLDRILALDPLFPDDLLDEMRKELSDAKYGNVVGCDGGGKA